MTARELAALRPESLEVLMDIVNKCNLRCIMCHFTFDEVFYQRSQLMLPETFARIAASIRPYTKKLTLSAAYEPTVSPHFAEILRIAASHGFSETSFLTNGNLLSEALCRTIVECNVTEVCISVHAARRETYAHILRGGSLDKTIANIERLCRLRDAHATETHRLRLQFNIALMRSNLDELTQIIELAARLGVDSVAFRHLIVFDGLDMESESLAHHDRRVVNARIQHALERASALGVGITNSPDYFDVEGDDSHSQCVDWLDSPVATSTACAPHDHAVGNIEVPDENATCSGTAISMSGWALSPVGIRTLYIARDPAPDESGTELDALGLVKLGIATFHNCPRPDVVAAYPNMRNGYRAAWRHTLPTAVLPRDATDTVLKLVSIDSTGHSNVISQRRLQLTRTGLPHSAGIRCHKPFDSLYIDARAHVYPYPDCHTDRPFGEFSGKPFDEVWNDDRLMELREQIVAGQAPEMCRRCPLFINREVDLAETFAAHGDFSREDRR